MKESLCRGSRKRDMSRWYRQETIVFSACCGHRGPSVESTEYIIHEEQRLPFLLALSELPNRKGKVRTLARVCTEAYLPFHTMYFIYSASVNGSVSQLWSDSRGWALGFPSPAMLFTHKTITYKDKPLNQRLAVGFPLEFAFPPDLGNFWKQHFIWQFLIQFLSASHQSLRYRS